MTWHEIPMLRLLLPFIGGIIVETYCPFGGLIFISLIVFVGLLLGLLAAGFKRSLSWRGSIIWAICSQISLILLGAIAAQMQDRRGSALHYSHLVEADSSAIFLLTVGEPPQEKGATIRSILEVVAVADGGAWRPATGEILASIGSDSAALGLAYGDRIIARLSPKGIAAPLNPRGLDLRQYYATRGIYSQAYLGAGRWRKLGSGQGRWLWENIYNLRAYLLTVFARHCPTADEYAVVSGLVLGVRDDIDKTVIQAYADVGAMHILSVSGLHVGLIAWLLMFLFDRLPIRRKWWSRSKAAVVVGLIWLFALLTGCTPPALRSAAMFSFVVIGQQRNLTGNIYNSLATSAFFLLCFNPLWLWDAGFQLSYLALLGIVFYQARILKLIYIERRWLRWVWDMTAVSLAASLTTFSLGLFYFHQFSFSSFLSGLLTLPLATALLPAGFILLLLDWLPFVSTLLGWLVYGLVWLLNKSVFLFQLLPYSVFRGAWFGHWGFWSLNVVVILATLAFYYRRGVFFVGAMAALAFFAGGVAYQSYSRAHQKWLCIYHLPRGSALGVAHGRAAVLWTDTASLRKQNYGFALQNHFAAQGLAQPQALRIDSMRQTSNFYYYTSGLLLIDNYKLGLIHPNSHNLAATTPLLVDAVLIRGSASPQRQAQNLARRFRTNLLVLDGSNSAHQVAAWRQYADSVGLQVHYTGEAGALLIDLSKTVNR